jgi:hypothetical protein
MGRSAYAVVRQPVDHFRMEDSGILHRIQDDLSERWLEEWAEGGVTAIETYLAKHLAFLSYLDLDEASA